eukprot:Protomagalhaensia_sp_Gyna_25__5045@NODE_565_length_3117_cov_177_563678_g439_i0_p3_GENE_NODE_565_length_3117_cov_177_563678_g439_i0NODE_565_length_3117_cov_177_563678_g439_i0_p3_ORF_typecomplete_len240_score37_50DUF4201/PF13870_6/0_0061CCDC73/PF15818_5/0_023Tht1/PF04163_12/0_04WEMBL/PF05701_11/0_19TPR_MLP1_2/PF07926_12/32TPR_MLP1_2/PF07926_12/56LRRFIP/PF09738_9/1_2JAKMIP_CC3/PF16034_5/2_2Atg14/PF10186_9/1_9Csm1_N/PF18504_1/2_1e03Csm1_N/PF18504_1/0_22UPF0242/PF06785_11/5_8DivIVA/PF05103_13/5_1e02D
MDQLYNAEPIYQAHASVKKVVSNTERRALNNDIGWVKDEGCRLARDILEAVRVILDGLKEQGPELHKEALNRNEELRKLMESSQIQREMNYQGLQHISLEHTNLMKENNTLKQKLSDTKRLHSQLKQETAGAREEFKRVVAANKVEQVLLARITRVTSIKRELDWVECGESVFSNVILQWIQVALRIVVSMYVCISMLYDGLLIGSNSGLEEEHVRGSVSLARDWFDGRGGRIQLAVDS